MRLNKFNSFKVSLISLVLDGISLFVDGEKYGEVIPPSEGFYKSASENHVQAASQWLKGTVMAPFDDMVSMGMS